MKVKSVIKGLLKEYDLEEVNIISTTKVIFSGSPAMWKATDVDMILYKKQVMNLEVINRMMFNRRKAFIFVPDIDTYYPPKD